jgi:roadblock/LC7 domain-containing protein
VTDEQWAEISADVTDWDAFIEKALADEPATEEAPEDAPAEGGCGCSDASAEPAEVMATMQSQMTEMAASMAAMKDQFEAVQQQVVEGRARATEIAATLEVQRFQGEIAASMFQTEGGTHRYAASAVEVLASMVASPSAESAKAVVEHLKANGGRMCLIPVGEIGASMTPAGEDADEAYLAGLGETDDVLAKIRKLMVGGVSAEDAAAKYFGSLNPR